MLNRRRLAALTAATLTIGVIGALPAAAEHVQARSLDPACDGAPEDGLTDAGPDGGEQETAVDCLAWYEVTTGRTATTYDPRGEVIRGEMAAFLARVMRSSETPFAEAGATEDYFVDDNGGIFEDDINFVAKHDVADGTSQTEFSPGDPVLRGQMAKFLVNMLTAVGADVPEPTQDYFSDDDGNIFEDSINQVAELGIASGVSDTEYAPGELVDRGQMARFVARSMAELVEQELLLTPDDEGPVTTDAPELVTASDASYFADDTCETTATADDATHVRLALGFDEAITGRSVPANAEGFELVGFDAVRGPATAAQLSDTDDSVALVCFDVDDWTNATTVTVRRDTVGDVGDLGNPEGAVGTKSVTLSGTTAPELVSVTLSGDEAEFTFDEAIETAAADQFVLVAATDGDDEDADPDTFAGTGTPTVSGNRVTVTFPSYPTSSITRAAALGGAVQTADDEANAVSVLDVAASGLTAGPDLASVTYVPDATRVRDTDAGTDQTVQVDEVRYVFDVSVLEEEGNLNDFVLVTADGETKTPTINQALADNEEEAVERSSADARVVVVEFEDGALQTTTGAAVLDSAVRAAGGTQPVNRVDAMARSPQLTYAAGETLAPAPTAVEISSSNVILGTTYTVTLTFDDAMRDTFYPSTVSLYDAQGRSYTITGTPSRDNNDPTVVTVTSSPLTGRNAEVAEGAVLVGLAPDTVSDDEGHGSHPQVIAP